MGSPLERKKILLAITGGIAAYKSAQLCRELKKVGAEVRVVMTASACEFITPLTLQALSGNPVHTELLDPEAELGMGHIELAKWPDLVVVAPATANLIAKYAQGLADDLLSTLLLATNANVMIAPAMNQAMWSHPATQRNIAELKHLLGDSIGIIGPGAGEQACGDVGYGRMLEPLEICNLLEAKLAEMSPSVAKHQVSLEGCLSNELQGLRVVITAGPTREALDPVRYISNHSSGKMGYALAESFCKAGAKVSLVSGPTQLSASEAIKKISIESASDMLSTVMSEIDSAPVDIFVACAAVADYAPSEVAAQKMKKTGDTKDMILTLVQNPDIVATVAARTDRPFTVGFAAETNDVLNYARGKLKKKNLDLIVANDVSDQSIGFNSDENEVHLIGPTFEKALGRHAKSVLADLLVQEISNVFKGK